MVQQAECGADDPTQLCEYEQLRERNIKERNEAMREALGEIDVAKQDMRDNAPRAKKEQLRRRLGGMGKKQNAESVVVESMRESYVVEEDICGRSRRRGRRVDSNMSGVQMSPVRRGRGRATSKAKFSFHPILLTSWGGPCWRSS